MVNTHLATSFLEELNDIFFNELSVISALGNDFCKRKINVMDSLALLKSLDEHHPLAIDIRYCICSAAVDAVEGHIALELERRQLLCWEDWCAHGQGNAEGTVYFNEELAEYVVSMRIKSYSRIYVYFSESELRNIHTLQQNLTALANKAAENLFLI